MSDILERLENYNPPDRTVDESHFVAVDIQDAAEEIRALRSELSALRERVRVLEKVREAAERSNRWKLTALDHCEDCSYGFIEARENLSRILSACPPAPVDGVCGRCNGKRWVRETDEELGGERVKIPCPNCSAKEGA